MEVVLNKRVFLFLGLVFLSIKFFIGNYTLFSNIPTVMDNALIIMGLICFLLAFVIDFNFKLIEIFLIIAVTSLVFISTAIVKEYILFLDVIVVIASLRCDKEFVIKSIYKINICLMAIALIISFFLIIFGYLSFSFSGVPLNNALGFSHKNIIAGYVLWIMLNRIYIHKKVKMNEGIIYLFISCITYLLTGSDIFLLSIFVFILLYLYIVFNKKEKKCLKIFVCSSFLIFGLFVGIGIISIYQRNGLFEFYSKIDYFLTGRLKLAARYLVEFDDHSFSIFGKYAARGKVAYDELYKLNNVTIDGLYISFFLQYGIIWFLIFSVLFFKTCWKLNDVRLVIMLIFSIYALAEVHCLNIVFSFPCFIIIYDMFEGSTFSKSEEYFLSLND